jgi:uncharacterized membrane protein (DUF106 family)
LRSLHLLFANAFDAGLAQLRFLPAYFALTLVAAGLAIVILLAFRYASDQRRLLATKNAIKAHLLELWLFRDDVPLVLRAQRSILRLNLRYLGLTLKPLLVTLVPLALVLISLDGWFGARPLRPGEAAVVSVHLADSAAMPDNIALGANGGLTVETPALRIPATGELDWRIRALQTGRHHVWLEIGNRRIEKDVVVSETVARVSAVRTSSSIGQAVLHPLEAPVPPELGVDRIEVHYAPGAVTIFSRSVHWLIYLFLASVVFVFVLKRRLGVEV